MRAFILSLFVVLILPVCGPSFEQDYTPKPRTDRQTELTAEFARRRQNLLKSFSYAENEVYGKVVEESHRYYLNNLQKGSYLLDSTTTTRVKNIFDRLVSANELPIGDELILIVANAHPNAWVGMFGIIEITTGLLAMVENDDELAFIIGHEITHYLEGHIYKRITLLKALDIDNAMESEMEKISRGRGTLTGLTEAQKRYYTLQKFARKNELICDSTGIVMMQKAGFDATQALSCMQRLGLVAFEFDRPYGQRLLSQLFTDKYPFKEYWLEAKPTIYNRMPTYNLFFRTDSILTHPDKEERLHAIGRMVDTTALYSGSMKVNLDFAFENVESAYTEGQLDICLFLALKLRLDYPDNVYLKAVITKVFLKLHSARTDQTPENHPWILVNYYTIEYGDDLKMINHFLTNITKEEALEIAYHYLNNPKTFNVNAEEQYYLLWELCDLTERRSIGKKVAAMYTEKFPNGSYWREMK